MSTAPIISVKNLSYYRKPARAIVQNLSFSLSPGKCMALVGANGTGKSTTLHLLAGLLKPYQGHVLIHGIDLYSHPTAAKALIGFLPDRLPLHLELTVNEFAIQVAGLRQIPKKQRSQQIKKWLQALNLEERQHQLIETLSKGQKQRVGLLQAFLHEPSVVLLDEPTQGLDSEQIEMFLTFIAAYKKNTAVIFSTHHLSEVKRLCDFSLHFTEQGIQLNDLHTCIL